MVALKLQDGKEPSPPDSYDNNDLVTYDEARKLSNPKPYIAAVVTSKNENMFILGDGTNTSDSTSRRRRSTSNDYYNGPLEPGTSYRVFQRIFINKVTSVDVRKFLQNIFLMVNVQYLQSQSAMTLFYSSG